MNDEVRRVAKLIAMALKHNLSNLIHEFHESYLLKNLKANIRIILHCWPPLYNEFNINCHVYS